MNTMRRSLFRSSLTLGLAFLFAGATFGAEERELIAILDLKGVKADEAEVSALTDRLREEMFRGGRFALVDRSQIDAVLDEQALQQTGCTEQECAVQVGRILGVRKMVAGKVTKISDSLWLVSGIMVDVETAQTLRSESVQHQGDFLTLMGAGIAGLASKLSGIPSTAGATPSATADQIWREPVTGIEFVLIPGGSFEQGCGAWASNCNQDERPTRWVTLRTFWLGRTEVTQAQWSKVMGGSAAGSDGNDRPVEGISWNDAQEFLRRLRAQVSGATLRLPSEAEWEFACRGGGKPISYGTRSGQIAPHLATYDGRGGPSSVGSFPPNALGLHDLSGNVWEWTQDTYSPVAYQGGSVADPLIQDGGSVRVLRGGGWDSGRVPVRCSYRGSANQDARATGIGLRLAVTR